MNENETYLLRRIGGDSVEKNLLDFPAYIEIETVNACNARCPMCTIDDWQRKSPTMTDDIFNRILGQLSGHIHKVKRVSLYRDGEPLLDKRLEARVRALKDIGTKEVAIATNVQLLNAQRASKLLDSEIDLVIFSIDSLKRNVFEAIRARLDLDIVLKNAQFFIEERNRRGSKTKIWIRMIRQKSNFSELQAFKDFWSSRLSPGDRCYHHDIFNWGGQLKRYEAISENSELSRPCVALWSLFVIFSDGSVPMCNVDYNSKVPIGNIMENDIADLWKSSNFERLRRLHLEGSKAEIPLCISCDVWNDNYLKHEHFGVME